MTCRRINYKSSESHAVETTADQVIVVGDPSLDCVRFREHVCSSSTGLIPKMPDAHQTTMSRRDLLSLIGSVAGGAAMYEAMTSLGFASESGYKGPLKLEGDVKGASVLVLGAGLAGMTAALELRKAGYKVQVLEFNSRPGGRNWTIRGGDSFTELGGETQKCEFEQGLYINPGPWRIPYHHRAVLDYCKRLNVALEPFVQLNHNALLHGTKAFGGQPQRIRDIKTDFQGHVSELLAKVTQQGKLDEAVSAEDREMLLQAMKSWGALDEQLCLQGQPDFGRRTRLCQGARWRPRRRAGRGRTDRHVGPSEIAALAPSSEFRAS